MNAHVAILFSMLLFGRFCPRGKFIEFCFVKTWKKIIQTISRWLLVRKSYIKSDLGLGNCIACIQKECRRIFLNLLTLKWSSSNQTPVLFALNDQKSAWFRIKFQHNPYGNFYINLGHVTELTPELSRRWFIMGKKNSRIKIASNASWLTRKKVQDRKLA